MIVLNVPPCLPSFLCPLLLLMERKAIHGLRSDLSTFGPIDCKKSKEIAIVVISLNTETFLLNLMSQGLKNSVDLYT